LEEETVNDALENLFIDVRINGVAADFVGAAT